MRNYFAHNLRFLRELKDMNQAKTADSIGFNKTTWNNYETGKSKPNIDDLFTISKFFQVSISELLEYDLSKAGNLIKKGSDAENEQNGKLKGKGKGNLTDQNEENSGTGGIVKTVHFMPQVITVDSSGNENVVMVPVRARAGYLNGYADPKFMETLPAYRLPGLNNGTFRLFEVEGLSMYPTLHGGDLIIGSYVEQLRDVRDDRVYVVVTRNAGIVVKRCLNRIQKDGKLILKSDNHKDRDMYPAIVCDPEDILEIWYATGFLSRQLRPPAETYNRVIDLEGRLTLLEETLKKGQPK